MPPTAQLAGVEYDTELPIRESPTEAPAPWSLPVDDSDAQGEKPVTPALEAVKADHERRPLLGHDRSMNFH